VLSVIEAGAEVRDKAGNVCGTHTAVANTDPPGALPPTVVPVTHVFKVINYDPTTGTGDEALTEYSGGECRGATFDGTRATQVLTGTLHFVISGCGNRIDSVVTALNLSGVGGFSLSFTELQQSPRTSDFCNSR
jgi:hypothetical protein